MWLRLSFQKHIHNLVVKRSTAVLARQLMSLIDKQVVYLHLRLADQQVQQTFRCENEDIIVLFLQCNITGRSYHTIIAAVEVVDFLKIAVFTEVVNNLTTDFVYECLCRHNQSIVFLCAVDDLILDKHPHDEGLPHRSRSRIAEAIIGQMIICCFLSSKKLLIRFGGNRKIVIPKFREEPLQRSNVLIFGIDVFYTLMVSYA